MPPPHPPPPHLPAAPAPPHPPCQSGACPDHSITLAAPRRRDDPPLYLRMETTAGAAALWQVRHRRGQSGPREVRGAAAGPAAPDDRGEDRGAELRRHVCHAHQAAAGRPALPGECAVCAPPACVPRPAYPALCTPQRMHPVQAVQRFKVSVRYARPRPAYPALRTPPYALRNACTTSRPSSASR